MGDEKGKKELLDEDPGPRQRITNLSAAETNHKQAEPSRMASDWLEIAERAANAGFYDWDMRTGQLTWSEGFYQLFGLPPTALPSFETWLTVVHPDDREPALARINESIVQRISLSNEYRIVLQGGQERWINALGDTFYDEAGNPVRNCGVCVDITEHKRVERVLRHSEEQLRFALETIHAGAWDLDLIDHSAFRSLEHDRIFGYDHFLPEWTYEMFLEHVLPEDRAMVDAKFQQAMESQSDWSFECRIRRTDGQIRWIYAAGRHTQDGTGTPRRMAGIVQDITERKQAEETLRESEERFRTLAQAALAGIGISEQGRIVDANEQLLQIFGGTRTEVIGKEIATFIAPEDRDRVVADIIAGVGSHTEHRMFRLDGRPITVETHGRNMEYQGRQVRITSVLDITDRKRMEHELRQSERLYRAIGESINYGVWVCAPDGRNIYASESFLKMVGLTQEECSSFGWGDVLHPDDTERTIAAWQECVRTEGVWDIEHRFRGVDGRYHHVLARGIPVRDDQGQIFCWAGINLDINSLKQAQLALEEARGELERRVEERTKELQRAYENLKEETRERERAEAQLRQAHKMEAIGTFAGGIAHDFNNILAAILGFTEMALEDVSDRPDVEKNLQRVLKSTMRARDLVKQILAFSRKAEHARSPIALSPLITETIQLLRASIPSTIDIVLNITATTDTVLAAPVEAQQLLMNLASNASLAMQEKGGTLEISLNDIDFQTSPPVFEHEVTAGEYVQLVVRDTGIGMTPGMMKRVFEPFYTTREVGKGTGMGLAVVYGIVKSLNGTITVESEPGVGSTFRILLPKAQTGEKAEPVVTALVGGHERILFVDDEDLVTELNGGRLKSLGYEVVTTTSSREALDLFERGPSRFDLVITDYTMPHLTGIDLADKLLSIRGDIPIILCTGHSDSVSPKIAQQKGFSALLMKPLSKQELAGAIRRVLDKKRAP